MPEFTFSGGAFIQPYFSVGAWIVGDRWRHDINNDHFGDLSSMGVIIESQVGPWAAGTPLHYVLDWLVVRIIDAESVNKQVWTYDMNAYVLTHGDSVEQGGTTMTIAAVDAVIYKSYSKSFTAEAVTSLSFTLDAVIRGYAEMTIDAVVV